MAGVGSLAQLVERLVYTENVGGSSPSRPTIVFIFIADFRQPVGAGPLVSGCGPVRTRAGDWRHGRFQLAPGDGQGVHSGTRAISGVSFP